MWTEAVCPHPVLRCPCLLSGVGRIKTSHWASCHTAWSSKGTNAWCVVHRHTEHSDLFNYWVFSLQRMPGPVIRACHLRLLSSLGNRSGPSFSFNDRWPWFQGDGLLRALPYSCCSRRTAGWRGSGSRWLGPTHPALHRWWLQSATSGQWGTQW